MSIKEKFEENIPKYLREKDLKSLDDYKYHGAPYTYVETMLNPFWTWFDTWFPDWMAPNTITLLGLVMNLIAGIIVLYYDPTLTGKAPSWAYLLASFALINYLNFDSADGKQARRLHASSPLGQLFDHGCDAVNEVFILIVLASACGTGANIYTSSVLILQITAFSLAQLLEYHTEVLVVGNQFFGTTESIILVSGAYFLAGVIGVDRINTPISSYLPIACIGDMTMCEFLMVLTNIGMIFTILYLFATNAFIDSPIPPEDRGEKNLSKMDFVTRMIPAAIMAACSSYLMLCTPLMQTNTLLLYFYCGFSFSFLSTRVNISHLCRRRLDWKFVGMYPMIALTLNAVFHLVNDVWLLKLCSAILLIMYSWYVATVIIQIKRHLHIRAFHITSPKSE